MGADALSATVGTLVRRAACGTVETGGARAARDRAVRFDRRRGNLCLRCPTWRAWLPSGPSDALGNTAYATEWLAATSYKDPDSGRVTVGLAQTDSLSILILRPGLIRSVLVLGSRRRRLASTTPTAGTKPALCRRPSIRCRAATGAGVCGWAVRWAR